VNRRLGVVVLTSAATLGAALRAAAAPPGEGILEVHGEAVVRADGTVAVDETILVLAAGDNIAHGISQDIATRHDDRRGARPAIEVDVAGVTRDGQPETFAVEPIAGAVRVRIGDARLALSAGTHVYVVSYRTRNQLGFFVDHDELAWNVTGDMGGLPVEQASAVVRLPVDAARAMGSLGGFISRPGSAAAGAPSVAADRRGLAAVFTGRRRLAPHEALTAVVTWPKGFVAEPGILARAARVVREHRALLLALLALGLQVVCLRVARTAARWQPDAARAAGAPAGAAPEPPEALSPGALRFAVGAGVDDVALAAALLGMADKGTVTIAPAEAGGEAGALVVSRAARGEAAGAAAPEERALAAALFAAGDAVALERENGRVLAAARRALEDACAAAAGERYFFARAHHALPGLLLSAAALGALAAGAQGGRARAAALALALVPWTAAAAGLVAGCARLWRRARSGRAAGWSALALAAVAAELAGLVAFASLTSLPAAAVVVVTAAIDVSLLRVPPIATAAGRALRERAAATRAALAAADPIPRRHLAHAVALGLRAPAASLAERLAAAVQASLGPGGASPPSPSSSSAERMASTRTA
jgi:hypothetical protein